MPQNQIIADAVNFEELQQAFADAPKEAARWIKTPLFRFARRVTKRIKRESLSGRPGIEGGPWKRAKDKNVKGFSVGNDLSNLKAVNKVSRILRTHVEGAIITPKQAGLLWLSKKTGVAGKGKIFAFASSVKIPARVKVVEPWNQETPKASEQVLDAAHRAVQLSIDRRMKSLTNAVRSLTSL